MKKYTTHRRQRGQAIVIIAGALVALLALVALAVDGSNAFAQRRNAQNATDGASAAGTNLMLSYFMGPNRTCSDQQHPCQEHPLTAAQDHAIFAAVQETLASQAGIDTRSMYTPVNPGTLNVRYIDQDGHTFGNPVGNNSTVPLAGSNGPGSPGAAGVWVATTSSSPTYFARILGIENVSADAHSSAQIGNPESAVWPAQLPDQSGNLPALIVWPLVIQRDDLASFNGTLDIWNFDKPNWGSDDARFDVLNYSRDTNTQNQSCRTGHWVDMRCQLTRGYNAANSETPFRGFEDNGGAPGNALPDMQKVPLGSDSVNQNSRGVWVQADTQNRLFSAWAVTWQNTLNFHWTLLMPVADIKTSGSSPKYRVVNMAAVKIISGERCVAETNNCNLGGTPLPNTAHFRVQFKTGEWNTGRGDFGNDIYKSVQNGQFVLVQGH